MCEVCGEGFLFNGRFDIKAYRGVDIVHPECVSKPEFPCRHCWLIHAGDCW
jgi:hypothetical protein